MVCYPCRHKSKVILFISHTYLPISKRKRGFRSCSFSLSWITSSTNRKLLLLTPHHSLPTMNFRTASILLLSTVATSTATKSDKVIDNSHYRIFSKAGVDKIFVSGTNSPKTKSQKILDVDLSASSSLSSSLSVSIPSSKADKSKGAKCSLSLSTAEILAHFDEIDDAHLLHSSKSSKGTKKSKAGVEGDNSAKAGKLSKAKMTKCIPQFSVDSTDQVSVYLLRSLRLFCQKD